MASRQRPKAKLIALALAGSAACALALLIAHSIIATPRVIAGNAGPQPSQAESPTAVQSQSYQGMLTDTRCGAKHSATIGMTASDCTRACVHGGEQFALVDGDTVYVLEGDAAALKHVAGQRVRIVGTLVGHKISVASVATP